MSDIVSKENRSKMMSRIRSSDTKPERDLRHYLWRSGYRYRINLKKLPGTPDIVLPKYKTAIFVHGCFWHGHDCKDYRLPKTNSVFWAKKIITNRNRDEDSVQKLADLGWNTIIVWECELKKAVFEQTVTRVISSIISQGKSL